MADPVTDPDNLTDPPDGDEEVLGDTFEEDATRPRFAGKKRQWLNYTQEARDASISLDRIEDANLASHLYNAHKLKRRRLESTSNGSTVKSYLRKERWGPEVVEGDGVAPKSGWTAWPVEPDRLPSAGVAPGSRLDNNIGRPHEAKADGRIKPSSDLEDCLLSEILRQARESFHARKAYGEASSEEEDDQKARDDTVETLVMSDEEQARSISQPVIRHIIAQFEKLLQALHASRQGHIRLKHSKDPEADETSGEETSRSRSRSVSSHGSSFASRIRAAPRDWSEVLGVAAMIGWKPEALRTTYLKCTELFDEAMDFVSLPSGTAESFMPLDMRHPRSSTAQPQANLAIAARAAAIDDLCCPYEDCSRHYQPYPIRWRLTEHLKRKHGEVSRPRAWRPVLPEDEIYGGVHLDGFLQPIDLPRRLRKRRTSVASDSKPTTSASESNERVYIDPSPVKRPTRSTAIASTSSEVATSDHSSTAGEADEASSGTTSDTAEETNASSDESRSDT